MMKIVLPLLLVLATLFGIVAHAGADNLRLQAIEGRACATVPEPEEGGGAQLHAFHCIPELLAVAPFVTASVDDQTIAFRTLDHRGRSWKPSSIHRPPIR